MKTSSQKPEILAAAIYFCAAGLLIACFHFSDWFFGGFLVLGDKYLIANGVAVPVLLAACIFSFLNRTSGRIIGLAGALLALPFFLRFEFSDYHFYNSWIALNAPGNSGHGRFDTFTLPRIMIPTIVSVLLAGTFSLLRLFPEHWRMGSQPIRDRVWPAFGASFLVLAAWYLTAATPYRFPVYHRHQMDYPNIFMLHVEKRGPRFREVTVSITSDGFVFVSRHERRLLEYGFEEAVFRSALSPETQRRFLATLERRVDRSTPYPPYVQQRGWNADRWFVYLRGPQESNLVNVESGQVPQDLLALFDQVQNLPPADSGRTVARDICLGFCYDPTF